MRRKSRLAETSSAGARSAHRSSTSSMPTREPHQAVGDGRRLGLPAAAPLERRLDAAERGGVHPQRRRCARAGRPRRRRRRARSRRSRRSRGSAPPRPRVGARAGGPARWALAWARSTRRCRVRSPRSASQASSVPGIAPTRSRRPLSTAYSSSSRGDHARRAARRCGRRGTSSPSARRCRRPASSGAAAGGWRRCCRRRRRRRRSWAAGDGRDVGELEGRVGRRLEPDQRGVLAGRRRPRRCR